MCDKIFKNVRFTFSYGDVTMGFDAPMPKSDDELADIIAEFANSIRTQKDAKKVVGECEKCFEFMFEGEGHVCS